MYVAGGSRVPYGFVDKKHRKLNTENLGDAVISLFYYIKICDMNNL